MLNSLIRAPLSFFEQTPTGRYVRLPLLSLGTLKFKSSRILNVFSKDIYSIDQTLPRVSLCARSTAIINR